MRYFVFKKEFFLRNAGVVCRILAAALAGAAASGCRSPGAWREAADKAAYGAIEKTRLSALGRSDEPFTIESPAESFRQRLIETQNLPVSDSALFGSRHLPRIPGWRDDFLPAPSGTNAAENAALLNSGPAAPELSLADVLQIAAGHSPEYQTRKESLFVTALALDLEEEAFRNTFAGMLSGQTDTDMSGAETVSSSGASGSLSASRALASGAKIAAAIAFDLVKLLTSPAGSALGLQFDGSITVPLGRGAGRLVASENLTQAQRDLLYAVWEFEHYKAVFAVETASRYFRVLSRQDVERNMYENYRRLALNAARARKLAEAGRLPELQVDQAEQEQLKAWARWLSARKQTSDETDNFKLFLGLPADARISLRREDLAELAGELDGKLRFRSGSAGENVLDVSVGEGAESMAGAALGTPGPMELPEERALRLALENRLDLRVSLSRVSDAQRKAVVAADELGAEISLLGQAKFGQRRSAGSAGQGDARLDPAEGVYSALLKFEPPFKRTSERNAFRRSIIALEQSIRQARQAEDGVKQQVKANLSALTLARESLHIQSQAAQIASRRVKSSEMFLEAGRAEVRDVLEAQDALLTAENALSAAMVDYRLAELELQKNLGLLRVGGNGLWLEMTQNNE